MSSRTCLIALFQEPIQNTSSIKSRDTPEKIKKITSRKALACTVVPVY